MGRLWGKYCGIVLDNVDPLMLGAAPACIVPHLSMFLKWVGGHKPRSTRSSLHGARGRRPHRRITANEEQALYDYREAGGDGLSPKVARLVRIAIRSCCRRDCP